MPHLKDFVSGDLSKNRAAMRKAATLSPEAHAERILPALEFIQITNANNFKEVEAQG
jgi:hypothetical protein